jgi:hypothetical protein
MNIMGNQCEREMRDEKEGVRPVQEVLQSAIVQAFPERFVFRSQI